MFGTPVPRMEDMSVFHSVWTYAIKALDARKKARWGCDGSLQLGQAKILDETYTRIALIKRVPTYSMLSRRPRTYSFMVQMCLMLLPRLPLPNRDSTIFTLTGCFENGGATTRNDLQFPMERLSLSYQQYRDTRNPLGYGRNMQTPVCGSVASLLLSMNLVFTPA